MTGSYSTYTSRDAPQYELHTFIFPPQKPTSSTFPYTAHLSIPQYFFPISHSLADEFLHPCPQVGGAKADCSIGADLAHTRDWPTLLALQPEWVLVTVSRFIEAMRHDGWAVAGMKFIDEEEERERDKRRKWEKERAEKKTSARQRPIVSGSNQEPNAQPPWRVLYYGGVFYGCWYGSPGSKGTWPSWIAEDGYGEQCNSGYGESFCNTTVIVGKRPGEVKCQVLVMKE